MLPHTLGDGSKRFFTFVPGKNEIDVDVWQGVQKNNAKIFEGQYPELIHPFESCLKTDGRANLFECGEKRLLETGE